MNSNNRGKILRRTVLSFSAILGCLLVMGVASATTYTHSVQDVGNFDSYADTVYNVPSGAEVDWDVNAPGASGDAGIQISGGGLSVDDVATSGDYISRYAFTSYSDNISYYMYAAGVYDSADIYISW